MQTDNSHHPGYDLRFSDGTVSQQPRPTREAVNDRNRVCGCKRAPADYVLLSWVGRPLPPSAGLIIT